MDENSDISIDLMVAWQSLPKPGDEGTLEFTVYDSDTDRGLHKYIATEPPPILHLTADWEKIIREAKGVIKQ